LQLTSNFCTLSTKHGHNRWSSVHSAGARIKDRDNVVVWEHITFNPCVQALLEALEVLEQTERAIRHALNLPAGDALSTATMEQLKCVSPRLIHALDSAMNLVQDLRDQMSLGPCHSKTSAAADAGSESREDCHSKITYSTAAAATAASGLAIAANQANATIDTQQFAGDEPDSTAITPTRSCRNLKTSSGRHISSTAMPATLAGSINGKQIKQRSNCITAPNYKPSAAQSSTCDQQAVQPATVAWLAGKQQKDRAAAELHKRNLVKEQQLLQRLQQRQVEANAAHSQVGIEPA
jgi:hypothetical protein